MTLLFRRGNWGKLKGLSEVTGIWWGPLISTLSLGLGPPESLVQMSATLQTTLFSQNHWHHWQRFTPGPDILLSANQYSQAHSKGKRQVFKQLLRCLRTDLIGPPSCMCPLQTCWIPFPCLSTSWFWVNSAMHALWHMFRVLPWFCWSCLG